MLKYSVLSGDAVTSCQWQQVAELFSSEYGFYSRHAPRRAGQRIRLGARYYEDFYSEPDYRIAFCHDGEKLVAHVIYREIQADRGRVAFVVQLVVAEAYRRRGIASTLLHAVWGFSDYYAWGIVTSNAFTVESLESATFRRARALQINARSAWLQEAVLRKIPFLSDVRWKVDEGQSRVESGFFTDRENQNERAQEVSSRLGVLEEGEEWLAIVFRDQEPDDFSSYQEVIDASSGFVAEAYRRMPQSSQPWASQAESEVSEILRLLPGLVLTSRIADFGAGHGRHLRVLRDCGFSNLIGIERTIQPDSDDAVIQGDCRYWRSPEPFDVILCLYDVIGSYSDDADNKAIVKNIAANLKEGGAAVISVSNFRYLDRAKVAEIDFDDPKVAAQAIFSLSPTDTMAKDGEFFDPNFLLVDVNRRLVCHKEQFPASSSELPGEYLIRDRRFTLDELTSWAEEVGLKVTQHRFVRAGFVTDYPECKGKEILVITRKL